MQYGAHIDIFESRNIDTTFGTGTKGKDNNYDPYSKCFADFKDKSSDLEARNVQYQTWGKRRV